MRDEPVRGFADGRGGKRLGWALAVAVSAGYLLLFGGGPSAAADGIDTTAAPHVDAVNNQYVDAFLMQAFVRRLDRDVAAAETAAEPAPAEGEAKSRADKSGYNLFHPTPPSMMRKFNTDRPDTTESPFTVDAGHFQAEFSFLEYTHDRGQGSRSDNFAVLPANLKVGLTNNTDLQLILNPYHHLAVHGRGGTQRNSGFGDTELRLKYNAWGNDGGATAGAVMPFVIFPTHDDGSGGRHVEGGLILPLSIELPGGFDLGTEAEFDIRRNERDDGYGVDGLHSVVLGYDVTERLNAYIEYVGIAPLHTGHSYLAYFDTGFTYALRENLQYDAGINFGLSDKADNFTVFTGLSFRW